MCDGFIVKWLIIELLNSINLPVLLISYLLS